MSAEHLEVARLDSAAADFGAALEALSTHAALEERDVEERVRAIVDDVRTRGDRALLELTNRYDRRSLASPAELVVAPEHIASAAQAVAPEVRAALESAATRIRTYHEHQAQGSWSYRDEEGNLLGQQVRPIDRVGVYVPGGTAAYPSSVLMNVLPASVAGVSEIVMTVPAPDGVLPEVVLAAAALAGVTRVVTVGGAQAVAALAYGTQTVPRVDKIVGPGNRYVAAAKRLVFGAVGIDMVAGPSEIVVVCDGQTSPEWIAMDLFSQAEHDEQARAILISPEAAFIEAVAAECRRLLPGMARRAIIARALNGRGAFIRCADLDEAVEIVNAIAPEHLELSVAEPEALLARVRHAGAVFLGRHTPEAFGDYCAGANHVLPTAGTARFSSALGVYDFQKRTSVIGCVARGVAPLAGVARVLAEAEGLEAHARSAALRGT